MLYQQPQGGQLELAPGFLPSFSRLYIGRQSTIGGAALALPVAEGPGGVGFSNAALSSAGFNAGTGTFVSSNGAGTGDYTIAISFSGAASSSSSVAYYANGSPGLYLVLNGGANWSSTLTGVSGSVALSQGGVGVAVPSVMDGRPHTIIFTRISGVLYAYCDDLLVGSAAFTNSCQGANEYIGGYQGGGYGIAGASITMLGLSNSGIQSDAAKLLSQNPWQLFLDRDEEDEALMFATVAGGSSDTPINPGAGTLAITGYAPSVVQTANQGVSPGAAALTITGYAPSVTQGNTTNIAPDAAALMLTGYAPSIAQTANQSILPGAAALTITGFAPAVAQTDNHAVAPGAGALVITGYAPTITQQTASPNLTPGAAALAVVGYAPTITQAPAVGAPRYARPITDVAAGTWQPSVPGASLASMVDEPSADSSDYIYTNSPGSCEIALAPVQNPHSITGQVFRYQMWSPFGNGATVRLMCGAAVIAEWVHASLPTVPTIFPQTLSAAQCLSITDYNDLRLVAVAG